MRYLAASETVVDGGRRIEQVLPVPEIKTFPKAGGSQQTPTGDPFTAADFQDVGLEHLARQRLIQLEARSPTWTKWGECFFAGC